MATIFKTVYQYILSEVQSDYYSEIQKADTNQRMWYELGVIHDDESSESLAKGTTFSEMAEDFEKYAKEFGLDCIILDIWENPDDVENIVCLSDGNRFYTLLKEYFKDYHCLERKKMQFIGSSWTGENNEIACSKGYLDENYVFFDEDAFKFFRHRVCYIPENGEVEDKDTWYSRGDLIEVCNDNVEVAERMFDTLTWEFPEVLYEQWQMSDIIDEDGNIVD